MVNGIRCAAHEEGRMPFAENAEPYQNALTELMEIVVYFDEQRTTRSDCTELHVGLDIRCLHKA